MNKKENNPLPDSVVKDRPKQFPDDPEKKRSYNCNVKLHKECGKGKKKETSLHPIFSKDSLIFTHSKF